MIRYLLLTACLGVMASAVACRRQVLVPDIGGRPAQSLRADAHRVEGGWLVTMVLPAGHWRVEAEGEAQAVEVLPGEPRSMARWKVDGERWNQSERPFRFALVGPEGTRIPMVIRYTWVSRGGQAWLVALCRGFIPVAW